MTTKKLILALQPETYATLKRRSEPHYLSVQQYIYELIRKELMTPTGAKKKSNAGRPKAGEDKFLKYFTRDR